MHSASIGLALLCGGPAFALRPPPRRIVAKRTYAVNAAVLPTEACVALLYVAPLPPVGTIIGRRWRRIRGAAVDTGPLVAPPRDKNTGRYALLVLAYALRAAAPLSKVFFFFVALRLSDLPRYGAPPDERTPSTPVVRHVAGAAAAASALTVAAAPKTREVLAALWTSARAWEKNMDTYLARWIPPVGQGHVFRACYGLALALTVNFWMNEYFDRNPPSDTTGDPAPKT